MKIRTNYIENATKPIFWAWRVTSGLIAAGVLVLGLIFVILIYSFEINYTHEKIMFGLVYIGVVCVLLLLELYYSVTPIKLMKDKKKNRITYVYNAKLIKKWIDMYLRADSRSLVGMYYPKEKDVDKYKMIFEDENGKIHKVIMIMSSKKSWDLTFKSMENKTVSFCYYEKSRVVICFDENDINTYEKFNKNGGQGSLNKYV